MGNQNSNDEEKYVLGTDERRLIKGYWPKLKKKQPGLFLTTWLTVIESCPDIRRTFMIKPDQDPRTAPIFKRVTKEVEEFFYLLIKKYGLKYDKCHGACKDLGLRHAFYGQRGFTLTDWDIFMTCLMGAIEEDLAVRGDKRNKLIFAWQELTHFVVENMKIGYNEQMKLNEKTMSQKRREEKKQSIAQNGAKS